MSNNKIKDDYVNKIKKFYPKTKYMTNCLKAFIVGGLICMLGQGIQNMYINLFNLSSENVESFTITTLILIASVLTGLGVYDKIGQFSGAGSFVPVTGFANSLTSAAMEYKSEGFVLGVATNMFKVGGSVIVFAIVTTYIVGMIRYIFSLTF